VHSDLITQPIIGKIYKGKGNSHLTYGALNGAILFDHGLTILIGNFLWPKMLNFRLEF